MRRKGYLQLKKDTRRKINRTKKFKYNCPKEVRQRVDRVLKLYEDEIEWINICYRHELL